MSELQSAGEQLVERVLNLGVDGVGPWHSAEVVAKQARAITDDPEVAIQQLLVSHRRLVGAPGFVTSVGGAMALVVGLPADVTSFYAAAARLSAAIAALRGYDVRSTQVRSLVLITLLGEDGATLLRELGVDPKSRSVVTDLGRVPVEKLTELNHTVGYRLAAKFGQKGAVNLIKLVPFVGGGVGASVNIVGINTVARYAKLTFLPNHFGPYNSPGVTIIDQ
ncbi:MAG: hypothetical protein ABI251_04155 [Mycobacteriaceae bacterium]